MLKGCLIQAHPIAILFAAAFADLESPEHVVDRSIFLIGGNLHKEDLTDGPVSVLEEGRAQTLPVIIPGLFV